MLETKALDYYEFLQISPHADTDTIHRVYKFLASRFHPDNPESGDPEKFFLLKAAYDVLSDPDRRADYDAEYNQERPVQSPLSNEVDFMDSLHGEINRRLAVLAVLYYRRRSNPYQPEVSLMEVEKRMGFPRDYLDFTMWYLAKKGYITKADNSDFTLTAEGVDFVEAQRVNMPMLNKLLTSGNVPCSVDLVVADSAAETTTPESTPAKLTVAEITASAASTAPMIVLPDNTVIRDRRKQQIDRREGSPDPRIARIERRMNKQGRRSHQ
jgi:curved DNA-binding protein